MLLLRYHFFFFFKQKPAYESRISDWSSDVCSSDLHPGDQRPARRRPPAGEGDEQQQDGKGEPAAHGLTGLRREHRRHFFPYLVDRLERPHHDLEIPYLSVGVPADDVDAIDLDAVELADEFEAGLIAVADLAQIAKTVAAEDVARRVEIGEHLVAPLLPRVADRRVEHRILGEQRPERLRVAEIGRAHAC